ncbi:MAG: hypothetical protein PWQ82_818 [Thermosediminibacterales bacterium]|nr:hypothetical protein [Thermosediminibacterales bacterium]MDK2835763.1 hypothetical protein [Thermosediminibacterales bacterium]
MNVAVIIPAFNEAKTIAETIQGIKQVEMVNRVIVVDDGSTDETSAIAESCGVEVVRHSKNMGKGKALNKGLQVIRKADIVVFLDGDVGTTSHEIEKLILPLIDGKADITIAKFPPPKIRGGFGFVKFLAKTGLKLFTGITFSSPLSGQRAMTWETIQFIGSIPSGFGAEVGITLKAAMGGFRIKEVEVNMTHRETKRNLSGFIHRGRQFLAVSKVLLSFLFSRIL